MVTQQFLRELREKRDVKDAVFLFDQAQHLAAALNRIGLQFQTVHHGNRNTVERVFQEIKWRTSSFNNSFSHGDPETAETATILRRLVELT